MLSVLAAGHLLGVHDAVTVSWVDGRPKPSTGRIAGRTGQDGSVTSLWGLLLGVIFFVPLVGAAVGAVSGTLSASLQDVGICDRFVHQVRDEVTPGTSALFVLAPAGVIDTIRDAFAADHPQLILALLSDEQDAAIRAVFAD
ncbi:DUF1269 domain-containing protein [Kribbella amoyensis]|uniref:DUF1269 domain-containing protein n=1 Tax=Kribbella amoyensis TaxID=996641 RepID=UPI001EE2E98F|nr:DUF1269 domain-containing protein [Kribbella amoyensis]